MRNLMEFKYAQSGASSNTNDMGMRAMQSRAYEGRNSQYLLLKAPPASGKSRALMFLALDKLHNQGVVPNRLAFFVIRKKARIACERDRVLPTCGPIC